MKYKSALVVVRGIHWAFRVQSLGEARRPLLVVVVSSIYSQKIKPREVVVSSEVVRLGEEEEALGGRDVLGRP